VRPLKRALYFCAVACLVGVGVCAFQYMSMPNLTGEAIEAVDNHDRSALEDVEAAREQMPEAEGYLKGGALFLVGFAASLMLARRVR
jgi:hypothetical protein